ncbi:MULTISPECIES: 3'(2'),5'-bisphosphate nucleotidase CysQ [Vibrio]|jgi:3'(2'), 5'-bisphosphate nucleotidase|uniref:3'(2'),5'-bisphosphate nucleotidase CysQ n=8 Tax=Vibrio harveyi group TaxID=717610 RepID=A0A0H0YD78_VIBAL|nr:MULTISPECIES: 3'(2'),5'-bisphosphate nucleotidase CysQ [Vibrio]EEZ83668.1 CysQ protein [Vibrio alginolyticus 40B]KOY44827.1 3'-5'-bisphosphate nucleotidase [Vibrio parahaemolyticus]MDW1811222.1 3'(2'),5'-bisphosphate nucleotidase CysQ [Vibrio sp. Vb2362]MDW1972328.1 3'(2'),5'-bisphosphate nucleotidase CysQ [Vibrio sp. 945]MDW2259002.1 3'(2'),5'-bisphosphate nucleotidase CysQ [Vibrio sp. 1409]MDW2296261.1 3'(2'),5'-bisphosphate nucleotidase CysQ [Vibrio sp. 1404]NAW52316.1 3'(2'),5'-bispho
MPMTKDLSHLLPQVIEIARSAGQMILEIYEKKQYEAYTKSDETPVTSADIAAHKFITERLSDLTPDIPVLSEEDADISLEQRAQWERYWLVDPLDGTQEFIARSGDFATIIALVDNNRPTMGVVYGPVSGVTYYAYNGKGAWKIPDMSDSVKIHTHKHEQPEQSIAIAISRRQDINRITNRMSSAWNYDLIPLGSAALKACLVAEGAVDCYLRLGPTGEWDTAATQCIVEEAGGRILSTQLEPLSYNERETLENPNFIVLGDADLPWNEILQRKD